MKPTTLALLSVFFLTVSTHGGMLAAPVKIAAKVLGHRSGSVAAHVVSHHGDDAVKVVSHYGDDAAKAVVKGGGEMALHSAPKVSSAVDAAVAAAKAESAAAKPLSKTAAVLEAVKPKLVIGEGQASRRSSARTTSLPEAARSERPRRKRSARIPNSRARGSRLRVRV